MLIDAETLSAESFNDVDICIIGAGPAGIVLALELARQGRDILLVETGDFGENKDADSLSDGVAISEKFAPLNMYRRRAVGGASTIWGGRCIPYDPIDFEQRDYVDSKGWPIAYDQVQPYFAKAAGYLEIEKADFTPSSIFGGEYRETIKRFGTEELSGDSLERFSAPTNFGKRYKKEITENERIRLLVHATCTKLDVSDNGSVIERAEFRTLSGKPLKIDARTYVVASGGLESFRLLANSDDRMPGGIGNASGLLGIGFMSHIEGNFLDLKLPAKDWPVVWDFEKLGNRIYSRRRLVLTQEAQRNHGLLNFIMRFFHATPANPQHKDGILSLMFIAKRWLLPEYRRKMTMLEREEAATFDSETTLFFRHVGNIILNAPELIKFVPSWIVTRYMQYHRIPYVALESNTGVYRLEFNSEQCPNPSSRVFLTDDTDRLGMRRLGVEWRMSDQDVDSIVGAVEVSKQNFAKAGMELSWGSGDLRETVKEYSAPVGGHFIGATRMSAEAKDGIVNENLKVHGVENLYVLSASVFPTSSHANPTFTLVSMAARLGEHLAASA